MNTPRFNRSEKWTTIQQGTSRSIGASGGNGTEQGTWFQSGRDVSRSYHRYGTGQQSLLPRHPRRLDQLISVKRNGKIDIDVTAEDDEPGMHDVKLAMQQGSGTKGSLGYGLPSVERLMDDFEIRSTVSVGPRTMARKWRSYR